MDLISREEVHRVLAFYIYELATDALTVDEFRAKIRECIDGIPSQNKWIPVSERLPEEFECVLVCYKSQGGMIQCVTERFEDMDGSNRWSAMFGQKPIAWMPLPKPYKAESEE